MKPLKLPIIVIIIVLITAAVLLVSDLKLPSLEPAPTTSPSTGPDSEVSGLIKVVQPVKNERVVSPLIVTGEARGYWYFEASFPVKIYDDNGTELGVIPAQAQSEWMTEDFVPFRAILKFAKPTTDTGILVLEKDNPSGLPEHDAQLRIPVRFDLANWPDNQVDESVPPSSRGCKVGGCSSQLCVDESEEDVVTTCEFKAEYACYQSAKCERQEDGQCGWTPTEELVTCLRSAWEAEAQ